MALRQLLSYSWTNVLRTVGKWRVAAQPKSAQVQCVLKHHAGQNKFASQVQPLSPPLKIQLRVWALKTDRQADLVFNLSFLTVKCSIKLQKCCKEHMK